MKLLLAAAALLAVVHSAVALSGRLPSPTKLYGNTYDLGLGLGSPARIHYSATATEVEFALVFPMDKWLAFGPQFTAPANRSVNANSTRADLTFAYNIGSVALSFDSVGYFTPGVDVVANQVKFSNVPSTCLQMSSPVLCNDTYACREVQAAVGNGTASCRTQCVNNLVAVGNQMNLAPLYGPGLFQIQEFTIPLSSADDGSCDYSYNAAFSRGGKLPFMFGMGTYNNTVTYADQFKWERVGYAELNLEKAPPYNGYPQAGISQTYGNLDRQGAVAGIVCGLLFGLIIVTSAIAGAFFVFLD
jgi:hypothetical protein